MIRNVYRKVQTDLINKKQNLPGDREGLSVVGAEVVGLSVGDLVGFSYVEKKNCWGKITFHIFKGNNKSKLTVGSRVGWSVLIVGETVRGVGTFVGLDVIGLFAGCLDDGSGTNDGSSLMQMEPFHVQSALLHCLKFI